MCLRVNKVETERLKKELPDTIKVYKVVHKLDGGYYSFYQSTPYRLNEYVHAHFDTRPSVAFTKLLPLREIKHESRSGITKYLQEVY